MRVEITLFLVCVVLELCYSSEFMLELPEENREDPLNMLKHQLGQSFNTCSGSTLLNAFGFLKGLELVIYFLV